MRHHTVLPRCGVVRGAKARGAAAVFGLHVVESVLQSSAECGDRNNDHDGDEGDHDAVFDGGGAALISAKTGCEGGENGTHWRLLSE